MSEFARELAGWMVQLESAHPFRPMTVLAVTTIEARATSLAEDLASLRRKDLADSVGYQAGAALLDLLEAAAQPVA